MGWRWVYLILREGGRGNETLVWERGILILGFFLQKIHFSLEKQCKYMHTHTQFKLQRTSVTLKKFNHLSFQINGVFDFSADTIRVKLRLNTNLSYHIAYQESLSPVGHVFLYVQGSICFLLILIEVGTSVWVTELWFQKPL